MNAHPLPSSRIMVILNPYSGRGRGARIKATVQNAFSADGLAHTLVETTAPGQGIELAQNAVTDGYDTLVAVGGDGTVNEVINGAVAASASTDRDVKLGIISVGSGNDFAHTLGVVQDPLRSVQIITRGTTRSCDLGHAVIHTQEKRIERYFNNNFGIGLDPQVTLESFKIKRLSGLAMYGLAALRAIWKYQAPTMYIRWENGAGETAEWNAPLLLASIGNTPRSGGGFHLNPQALVDDGLLDLVMAANMSRRQILQLLPKAIPGKHIGDPAITSVQARTIQIRADHPFPLEMDGEVVTQIAERIDISVQPGRIQVIV